jgi:hypothetical protein
VFVSVVSFGGSPFELLCIVSLLACVWYRNGKGKGCVHCCGCELSFHGAACETKWKMENIIKIISEFPRGLPKHSVVSWIVKISIETCCLIFSRTKVSLLLAVSNLLIPLLSTV